MYSAEAFELAVDLINKQAAVDGEVMEGAIHDVADSVAASLRLDQEALGGLVLDLFEHFETALAA